MCESNYGLIGMVAQMSKISVPHDPDAAQKISFHNYCLAKLRKGKNIPLSSPLSNDENYILSMQMYSETRRAALHKQHALYLKLMRQTRQITNEKTYQWPPSPYGR